MNKIFCRYIDEMQCFGRALVFIDGMNYNAISVVFSCAQRREKMNFDRIFFSKLVV